MKKLVCATFFLSLFLNQCRYIGPRFIHSMDYSKIGESIAKTNNLYRCGDCTYEKKSLTLSATTDNRISILRTMEQFSSHHLDDIKVYGRQLEAGDITLDEFIGYIDAKKALNNMKFWSLVWKIKALEY